MTSGGGQAYHAETMIDFSKIKEDDDLLDDDEEVLTIDDLFSRVALPSCKAEEDFSWRKDSLCLVYPSIDFFDGAQPNKRRCRAICFECTVRERCLDYAMTNEEEFGVWGGLDAVERAQLKGKPPRKRNR